MVLEWATNIATHYGIETTKKIKKPQDTDFIFGNNYPPSDKHLAIAKNKYALLANVERIRIHDFRHSHISYLIGNNIDPQPVAERVGDRIETILSTYSHVLPDKKLNLK